MSPNTCLPCLRSVQQEGGLGGRSYVQGCCRVPRSFPLDFRVSSAVSFVDVANIGGRDRLIAYESGHLSWFDPESATERALVAATVNFNPPRRDEIPHVDVTRDVNGDGRDNLVVPDVDGFSVG